MYDFVVSLGGSARESLNWFTGDFLRGLIVVSFALLGLYCLIRGLCYLVGSFFRFVRSKFFDKNDDLDLTDDPGDLVKDLHDDLL